MKTTELIELQKSITQGDWEVAHSPSKDLIIQQRDAGKLFPPMLCTMSRWQDAKEECEQNARAIAMTPKLIAEVIQLRKALRAVTAGYVKDRDYNNWHRLHGPTNADLNLARAALANDK